MPMHDGLTERAVGIEKAFPNPEQVLFDLTIEGHAWPDTRMSEKITAEFHGQCERLQETQMYVG